MEVTQELEWLCHGDIERAELARQWLRHHGHGHIPLFLETLERERHRDGEFSALHYDYSGAVVRHPQRKSVLRLAELLADLGDCRALLELVRLGPSLDEPLLRLVEALRTKDTPEVREALMAALQVLRLDKPLSRGGLAIARALLAHAERNPGPELRAALPLLEPGFGIPLEFFKLQRRLKALLTKRNFPIPANAAKTTEDLPIPTGEKNSNAPS